MSEYDEYHRKEVIADAVNSYAEAQEKRIELLRLIDSLEIFSAQRQAMTMMIDEYSQSMDMSVPELFKSIYKQRQRHAGIKIIASLS